MKNSYEKRNPWLSRAALWAAALTLIPITAAVAAAPASVTIDLKEKALVEGAEVYLRDIGRILCTDPQASRTLDGLVIANAPPPGRSRPITAEYILLRLKQMNFETETTAVTGAARVQVTRDAIEVSEEKIAGIVDDFLRTSRTWGDAAVKVTGLQISADRTLPRGSITYRVVPPDQMQTLSTLPLAIVFDVNGGFQKTIRANVRVEALAPVVVTAKPIGRLKPITMEDLKVEVADLVELPAGVITDVEEIIGQRARRNLQAGEFLRPDLIEMPPLVKRGDMVVIVAEAEGIRVTAIGEVKSAGALGERVKVVNLDSNRRLSALVLDNKTVKVEF